MAIDRTIDDINMLLEEDSIQELDNEAIASVVGTDSDTSVEIVLYEFHIVFHAIYQTPVLYFRLTQVDGAPVAFDAELLKDIQLPGGNAQATLVAMDDHQVLGTPFYLLHPCETASAMALLLDQPSQVTTRGQSESLDDHDDQAENSSGSPRYLRAWLSLVQPLTQINPLMY